MEPVDVSRLQFGLTISFHYLYPPLTIGLGVGLVMMEGWYLRTRNPLYQRMTKYWVRVFALIFAIGVATGIVQEFQFGTNWANYSRYVGDVFGSALAAEGIFAFFLEAGFLAILVFGWDRVSPRIHFLSTVMVSLGSHFSGIWIVAANSWMQTPDGYRLVTTENGSTRAEMTDFREVVFNHSTVERLSHVFMGAWQAGAFLILSVSAWYLLHDRHVDFARAGMTFGLILAAIASIGLTFTGDQSARVSSEWQPTKFAAMEAVYPESEPADIHLFGWVDEGKQKTYGLAIPDGLSLLLYFDPDHPVKGLDAYPPADSPPVNVVFQTFHLMVAIGAITIFLTLLGWYCVWRRTLFAKRWLLWLYVPSVLVVLLANELGWWTAEFGRQPWIVYGLLRTSDGVSPSVDLNQVWTSVIMFSVIYSVLLALFLYLLNQKIQNGPDEDGEEERLPANRRQRLTTAATPTEAD